MSKLTLTRFDQSSSGTFGRLYDGVEFVAVTCERPDNGNRPMGCIPCGVYQVTPFRSPKMGPDFIVHNVPSRTMIEMHAGNVIEDTEGCILVGDAMSDNGSAITHSRQTLEAMLKKYVNGFELTITENLNA